MRWPPQAGAMAPQMRPTSAFRPLQSLDGHLAVFGAALDVLA
jgi:hypothetical protein